MSSVSSIVNLLADSWQTIEEEEIDYHHLPGEEIGRKTQSRFDGHKWYWNWIFKLTSFPQSLDFKTIRWLLVQSLRFG